MGYGRKTVAERDHFSLLRESDSTTEAAFRLGKDRPVRASAAPPHRSAPTMKQREFYVALGSDSMQRAMRLEDLPGAGEHPAVFIRIGVTKHHFLLTVP